MIKSTQGFLRFRDNEIPVQTDGRTDGQPENAPLQVGGIKRKLVPICLNFYLVLPKLCTFGPPPNTNTRDRGHILFPEMGGGGGLGDWERAEVPPGFMGVGGGGQKVWKIKTSNG